MNTDRVRKIAILWRGDHNTRATATPENSRLHRVFSALADMNVAAEPAVYSDEMVSEVREQLLQVDGVLVWVDPISDGHDRSRLDPLLREIASKGIWVSAHPDIILKMGVKDVLFRTRTLGWGTDTDLYGTMEDFRKRFPLRLASGAIRVIKQNRGNGGNGVWSVQLASGRSVLPEADAIVRVEHAWRDGMAETMLLGDFIDRCQIYLSGSGRLIDQPFLSRLPEGTIRCYMVHDRLVGFSHQFSQGLLPAYAKAEGSAPGKVMYGPAEPRFQVLRTKMESDWVPAMQRLLDIDTLSLPAIWDADFLLGPKTESGDDTYILCEINVSSVFPFPDEAVGKIAEAAVSGIQGR
ncbi:Cj0069 family protein [Acidiphilium iwatense]|uniref:Cj0069 family protein n=1 Tax=Acidiphilium iwatense TaxID=768198 RepID=A0ABS9E1Y8_9PROT|nr:Cj0069 family protein [Acidiphilium iwatense]MCF3948958.1 Cj0069 family protein [Acidiphilium iwatense]